LFRRGETAGTVNFLGVVKTLLDRCPVCNRFQDFPNARFGFRAEVSELAMRLFHR
jgi:hypothetical protein